ncbi:hypothetical protein TanjilG_19603 [Lupinus angustifolius]|uniref:Uncharacterized protein n=1 Tax=Lupinus angustifolius TaxID=3871 RepID=A0A1J7IEU7_LUPAN|nr:hypothetical protein TanjilG_19603 [Lupinus angustifolius]
MYLFCTDAFLIHVMYDKKKFFLFMFPSPLLFSPSSQYIMLFNKAFWIVGVGLSLLLFFNGSIKIKEKCNATSFQDPMVTNL